jgi:SpoVK/Ycf46/Vps4 family AAA+-type ATPase
MATNRHDTLDPALLRPGRLDRKIEFPNPDRRQKRLIFQVVTAKMNLHEEVDLEDYVQRPEKLSAAEITSIAQEAGLHAVRNNRYVSRMLTSLALHLLPNTHSSLHSLRSFLASPGTSSSTRTLRRRTRTTSGAPTRRLNSTRKRTDGNDGGSEWLEQRRRERVRVCTRVRLR